MSIFTLIIISTVFKRRFGLIKSYNFDIKNLSLKSLTMNSKILTSRDVMKMLNVCENTLLKLERNGTIKIDFRLSNRKRYYESNIFKALNKLT
jgi:hypothetical protein